MYVCLCAIYIYTYIYALIYTYIYIYICVLVASQLTTLLCSYIHIQQGWLLIHPFLAQLAKIASGFRGFSGILPQRRGVPNLGKVELGSEDERPNPVLPNPGIMLNKGNHPQMAAQIQWNMIIYPDLWFCLFAHLRFSGFMLHAGLPRCSRHPEAILERLMEWPAYGIRTATGCPPINVEVHDDPKIWCQTLAFRTPGDGNGEKRDTISNGKSLQISPIFPHFMLGKSATNFTVSVSCRSFPLSQSEAVFFVPG